ncbi:Glu-tRNA(Gln) amidotransferase subunit GatD [Candidatus Woesearchaeota archaeon]|nr:Glu-tRNA(Gln) amidotransferase subunit GatD [Candidatus Woesearchaeota archaeon]
MTLKKVDVKLKDGRSFEGVLIPIEDNKISLKLSSGYNLILNKKEIKSIKILQSIQLKAVKRKYKKSKSLPTISILHTGGTIASRVSYITGGVSSTFTPEDLILMFPELSEIANIESRLIQNMWSDDLRFKHFEILAKAIEKEIKKNVKGVIIGMGTDNLAVASAALAFIIENPPIPIILVGAQRSSDRGSTDAALNLISAANFITKTDFKGVAICMHGSSADDHCLILPPTKTKKLHTSKRDAFKPINDSPIAKIQGNNITFFKEIKKREGKFLIRPKMEEKVGLIKITINMDPKQFEFFKNYKGLIIEGTGLGHTPGDVVDKYTKVHDKIIKSIKSLSKSCIICMTSTCLFGRVNMNVYSKGYKLQEAGVIGNLTDMLPETAFIKLAWLLGNYKNKEQVKELMCKNLRGEISSCSSEEWECT